MGKFKGIVITDKILTDDELNLFLKRYNSENYESLIDSFNPDSQFDYFVVGDINEKDYIVTTNGEKTNSAKIKDIDFNNSINSLSDNLYCIVDKYHWYSIDSLLKYNQENSESELINKLLSSINNDKVLTIVTFHF